MLAGTVVAGTTGRQPCGEGEVVVVVDGAASAAETSAGRLAAGELGYEGAGDYQRPHGDAGAGEDAACPHRCDPAPAKKLIKRDRPAGEGGGEEGDEHA